MVQAIITSVKEAMDTLKQVLTDKTIVVGGGSIGMSFVEYIPEVIRVITLLAYLFYLLMQIIDFGRNN